MDYIDIMMLLTRSEPLTGEKAVGIINAWRLDPEVYQEVLNTTKGSVPLRVYDSYSVELGQHIFTPTDLRVLHPALACKFFEVGNDALTQAFLETLDYLTFHWSKDDTSESEYAEDDTVAVNSTRKAKTDVFYAWPYLDGSCVRSLSADIIEILLYDWNYVFDWKFDNLGSIYSMVYNKLLEAEKCCDMLAANSFNLFNWLDRSEYDVDVLAKHYCFANYALDLAGDGTDAYFRKALVHYLGSMWNNFEELVSYIVQKRIIRMN